MTRVLLITGARSLADDPAAEAWARARIAEHLAGCDLLIVGGWSELDAPRTVANLNGPAEWGIAAARGIDLLEYSANPFRGAGWVFGAAGDLKDCWAFGPQSVDSLRRNAAMVAEASRLAAEGRGVTVLALLDGRLPRGVIPEDHCYGVVDYIDERACRRGEHTLGLARRAGLTVTALTWDAGERGST